MILEGILVGKRANDNRMISLRDKCNGINLEGSSHGRLEGSEQSDNPGDCRESGLNCSGVL